MIFVMSKRVYLNKFCPLTPKEILLNANYYIADCPSPGYSTVDVTEQFEEKNGEWNIKKARGTIRKATSTYNIRYGKSGCLNPGPFVTTLLSSSSSEIDMMKRMRDTLFAFDNMRSIMEEVYLPVRRGNGILIIIYYDYKNLKLFGDLICQHLVDNFGEDITYLDPKYNPTFPGRVSYHCMDMDHVHRVTRDLKDAIELVNFKSTISMTPDIESSVNNITSFLAGYNKTEDMIHLYELLWPEDPLPRGKYTLDQVREIITAKIIDSKPRIPQQSRLNVIEIYDPEY